MQKDKKGLSDVVTTVLIVLLVLAAVAAVWAFINNLIQESGSSVTAAAECVGLSIAPVACTISGTTATVTPQWKSGTLATGTTLTRLTLTIIGGNGNRTISTTTTLPAGAGQTAVASTVAAISGGTPYTVTIEPTITVGAEATTCAASAPITCV